LEIVSCLASHVLVEVTQIFFDLAVGDDLGDELWLVGGNLVPVLDPGHVAEDDLDVGRGDESVVVEVDNLENQLEFGAHS